MSNKKDLQSAVKSLADAKKETIKQVNKGADEVDTSRQVKTEQPTRQG